MSSRDEVIEAVTREVVAALTGPNPEDKCADCHGSCAAHCSDKVRSVVGIGAGRISYTGDGAGVPRDLARYIDHTLLRPDATAEDIDRLCREAAEYGFAAVCVNPAWVKRAAEHLRGTSVKVASVVGFPFGATMPEVKAMEARRAIREGAREIDMVINIGALKSGEHDLVRRDIQYVADACHEAGVVLKVIIEAALLTDEEKVVASHLAKEAKADFVKTSTGYGPGGATVHDVLLMRETVGPEMGVKAAGGIRTAEDVRDMVAAGATRIGASAGVEIVTGGQGGQRY
jgi:deoxyribose-phosphate aldolase